MSDETKTEVKPGEPLNMPPSLKGSDPIDPPIISSELTEDPQTPTVPSVDTEPAESAIPIVVDPIVSLTARIVALESLVARIHKVVSVKARV